MDKLASLLVGPLGKALCGILPLKACDNAMIVG